MTLPDEASLSLADEVPLSLLTMVVGAVLGAILVPLGDAVSAHLMRQRPRGLDSAFLLFFAANGVWIIAEVFIEIFARLDEGPVTWPVAVPLILTLGLAALLFAIGFKHVPQEGGLTEGSVTTARALKFLIFGNILWVLGEGVETFAWEFWPYQTRVLIYPATWFRIIFILSALAVFSLGARAVWRDLGRQKSDTERGHRVDRDPG